MSKSKKIVKIVLNVFVWVFVVFSVGMTVLALAAQNDQDGVPAIGGKCILTVASDSMKPTFSEGDLLVADKLIGTEKQKVEIGQVISFYADLDGNGVNEINTHRVVEIATDEKGEVRGYVTWGDNRTMCEEKDKEIKWQYVICVWEDGGFRMPGVGRFISFLQQPKGFLIVIVLPLVLFFLYELYNFIVAFMGVKNAGKRQITAADEELIKQKAIEEYLRQQAEAAKTAGGGNGDGSSPGDGKDTGDGT